MKLLTESDNATGIAVAIRSGLNRDISHLYTLYVWGTFGGGTATLQISPDNVNWFATGVSVTEISTVNVEFRANFVRASFSGAVAGEVSMLLL